MTHTNTREAGFEQLIERALVGSTIEERRSQGIPMTAGICRPSDSRRQILLGLAQRFQEGRCR